MRESPSKLKRMSPHWKIVVTSKPPVGDISVVTLIRADTTLDHSQKAEKVCGGNIPEPALAITPMQPHHVLSPEAWRPRVHRAVAGKTLGCCPRLQVPWHVAKLPHLGGVDVKRAKVSHACA